MKKKVRIQIDKLVFTVKLAIIVSIEENIATDSDKIRQGFICKCI